jgi:RNA-directed DNA polymerase
MLSELKVADTLDKFAAEIGYSSSGLSFILYKMTDAAKYQTFDIPKANGGTRTIHAPTEKLKRLQTRLASVILECNTEINNKNPLPPLSHGFEKGRQRIGAITGGGVGTGDDTYMHPAAAEVNGLNGQKYCNIV